MIKIKSKAHREIECECCHCVLEYEDDDIMPLYSGIGFVCPQCGRDIEVEHFEQEKPVFPKNFFHFGNGAKIKDAETQQWCDKVFNNLLEADVGESYEVGSGDTLVVGFKREDEIEIVVAKGYYNYTYDLN